MSRHKGSSFGLPKYAHAFGPMPKTSLEVFADLGLTDSEIARYFNVPQTCITRLRSIWNIQRIF